MANEDTEFSPGELVIVRNLIINDKTYGETEAMVIRVMPNGEYSGKVMVRVNGTDVLVTKDRLRKKD
jgi:hypothetical protein